MRARNTRQLGAMRAAFASMMLVKIASGAEQQACTDDPSGMLAAAGMQCAHVLPMGCSTDLHDVEPAAPVGTFVDLLCPVSCDACSETPSVNSTAAPTALHSNCADDPQGMLALGNMDCAQVTQTASCDADMRVLIPTLDLDVQVLNMCPSSCSACPDVPRTCVDDADGTLAEVGIDCLQAVLLMNCSYNVTGLSAELPPAMQLREACPLTCGECGSLASASCIDDPDGHVATIASSTCANILTHFSCSTDMHTVSEHLPEGTFLSGLCPRSCGICSENVNRTDCDDDPHGVVAHHGGSCSEYVTNFGCDSDASAFTVDGNGASETFVSLLCPSSCGACPFANFSDGSIEFELFMSHGISFQDAKIECLRRGANLASIRSATEHLEAMSLLQPDMLIWIGLTSDSGSSGEWGWSDHSPAGYTNWGPGQPEDNGGPHTVVIYYGGLNSEWHDVPESWGDASGYLCVRGRSARSACQPGSFATNVSSSCAKCSSGRFNGDWGGDCEDCATGKFSKEGAIRCTHTSKCTQPCNTFDAATRLPTSDVLASDRFRGSCVYHSLAAGEGNDGGSQCLVTDAVSCRAHCDADPDCTAYKVGNASALEQTGYNCCLESCSPPTAGFNMSALKLCPPQEDAASDCDDDPDGVLASYGIGCRALLPMGCDTDLHSVSEDVAAGTFVSVVCPSSCAACLESPDDGGCTDDPDGMLASAGMACDQVVPMGCDTDMHSVEPAAPEGTFVSLLCPSSCAACPASPDDTQVCAAPPAICTDWRTDTASWVTWVQDNCEGSKVPCEDPPPPCQQMIAACHHGNDWCRVRAEIYLPLAHMRTDHMLLGSQTRQFFNAIVWNQISASLGVSINRVLHQPTEYGYVVSVAPSADGSNVTPEKIKTALEASELAGVDVEQVKITHSPSWACTDVDVTNIFGMECPGFLNYGLECAYDLADIDPSFSDLNPRGTGSRIVDFCPRTCGACAEFFAEFAASCEMCPHREDCGFEGGECRLQYMASPLPFVQAEAQCVAAGGHLVSVYDENVAALIKMLPHGSAGYQHSMKELAWIGFHQSENGQFQWTGKPAGEPLDIDYHQRSCPAGYHTCENCGNGLHGTFCDTDSDCYCDEWCPDESRVIGGTCTISSHRVSHRGESWDVRRSANSISRTCPPGYHTCDHCQNGLQGTFCDTNADCWCDQDCGGNPERMESGTCTVAAAGGSVGQWLHKHQDALDGRNCGFIELHAENATSLRWTIEWSDVDCAVPLPSICEVCTPSDAAPETCAPPACVDEPRCPEMLHLACDLDVHTVNETVPAGTTVSALCPASCGVCINENGYDASCTDDAHDFLRFLAGGPYLESDRGWIDQSNFVDAKGTQGYTLGVSNSDICDAVLNLDGFDCSLDLSVWIPGAPRGLLMDMLCPQTCAQTCSQSDCSDPDCLPCGWIPETGKCYSGSRCYPSPVAEQCVEHWDSYHTEIGSANPVEWLLEAVNKTNHHQCADNDDMLPGSMSCAAVGITCACDRTPHAARACCASCPAGGNPVNPRCACRDDDEWVAGRFGALGITACTTVFKSGWCQSDSTMFQNVLAEGESLARRCCKACGNSTSCPRDESDGDLADRFQREIGIDADGGVTALLLGDEELSCTNFYRAGVCGKPLSNVYTDLRASVSFGPALGPMEEACPAETEECWGTSGCKDRFRELLIGSPPDCVDTPGFCSSDHAIRLADAVRSRDFQHAWRTLFHVDTVGACFPTAGAPCICPSGYHTCENCQNGNQGTFCDNDGDCWCDGHCGNEERMQSGTCTVAAEGGGEEPAESADQLEASTLEQLCPALFGTCRRKGVNVEDRWGMLFWWPEYRGGNWDCKTLGESFNFGSDIPSSCDLTWEQYSSNWGGMSWRIADTCPVTCGTRNCENGWTIGENSECVRMDDVPFKAAKLLGCLHDENILMWHPWPQESAGTGMTDQGEWVYKGGNAWERESHAFMALPMPSASPPSEYPCREACTVSSSHSPSDCTFANEKATLTSHIRRLAI